MEDYLLEGKHSEAATQRCFIQKVFLKFPQNSERLCWSLKLQALHAILSKKRV